MSGAVPQEVVTEYRTLRVNFSYEHPFFGSRSVVSQANTLDLGFLALTTGSTRVVDNQGTRNYFDFRLGRAALLQGCDLLAPSGGWGLVFGYLLEEARSGSFILDVC